MCKGKLLEEKLLCSVWGHLVSSGIVTAQLFPWHSVLLVPNRTLHMPAASQVCTQILQQYSSLQGERSKTSEGEDRVTTERTWWMPESSACWVFMGSQKSSYTGSNVVCNFSLNPVLSCTAWNDKGNCSARGQRSNWENLVRSCEI